MSFNKGLGQAILGNFLPEQPISDLCKMVSANFLVSGLGRNSLVKWSKFLVIAALVSGFFVASPALATTSGPNDPAVAVNATGVGTVIWTNPIGAESLDSSYATANSLANGEVSNYLEVTNYGFSIPLGVTITGIKVDISRRASFINRIKDQEVKIVKGGSIVGTDQANIATWPNTDAVASYGGSSDLWGQSWTPTDINSSTFGLALAVTNSGTGSRTASVDSIKITITYIPANLTAYNATLAAVTQANYTTASWTAYQLVVTANVVTDQNTQAEVDTATANITAAQGSLVLDIIPPVISIQTIASPTESSLTAIWTTDHVATSRVIYDTVSHALGVAPNYGYANSTVEDTTVVTSHSVTITGLAAGTTYFFRTISRGSPEAVSDEFGGTTSSPTPTPTPSNNNGGGGGGGSVGTFINGPLANPTSIPTVGQVLGISIAVGDSTNLSKYNLKEGDTVSAVGSNDPDVYIVNVFGYKRLFLNPIIFNFYGHLGGWGRVKKIVSVARDVFPTSGLFRNCETNDPKVYGVETTGEDTGILHWVNTSGAQAVADDPNFFKKVFCINTKEFSWYSKGADYTSVNQIPIYNRQ